MDKVREKAWEECLMLWKELSEIPDQEMEMPSDFKNEILTKLGLKTKHNGCPFCEVYIATENCPLGDCSIRFPCLVDTPYGKWSEEASFRHMHKQECAKDFYMFLKKMYEKQKSGVG